MLKKTLLLTSILLAITACSKSENAPTNKPTASASQPVTSQIQAASVPVPTTGKVYRVGTDFTYAPYNQRNKEGVEGLDIDIMNAIAKDQNFQVEYVALTWDTLMENAKAQNLSVVMDGIAAEDLADYPDYVLSQPYMRSGDCIYVGKAENAANWNKNKIALQPEDLLDEELIKDHKVNKGNIKHIRTLIQGLQEIIRDDVQAVVSDCGALRYVAKSPLFQDYAFHESLLPNSERPESADLGFGVMKDDTELLNKINTGMQNIKQSGELDAIIKKWN